jgi:hypothetical protein
MELGNCMRLYVSDDETGEKTYIQRTARDKRELANLFGSDRIKVKGKVYSVNSVRAEKNSKAASAMALGGIIGVVGGVPGVLLGGLIGGLMGKSSEDEDEKNVKIFNGSNCVVKD